MYIRTMVTLISTVPVFFIGYWNFAIFRFWRASKPAQSARYRYPHLGQEEAVPTALGQHALDPDNSAHASKVAPGTRRPRTPAARARLCQTAIDQACSRSDTDAESCTEQFNVNSLNERRLHGAQAEPGPLQNVTDPDVLASTTSLAFSFGRMHAQQRKAPPVLKMRRRNVLHHDQVCTKEGQHFSTDPVHVKALIYSVSDLSTDSPSDVDALAKQARDPMQDYLRPADLATTSHDDMDVDVSPPSDLSLSPSAHQHASPQEGVDAAKAADADTDHTRSPPFRRPSRSHMHSVRRRARQKERKEVALVRSVLVVSVLLFSCFLPYAVISVVSIPIALPTEV